MDPSGHRHEEACNCVPGGSTSQTLSELEFERGIWCAAQTGDLERVRHFLNKAVCPNAEDGAGYTALHYAARNGHAEICRELLERGANANARTRSARATPLHRAATQKRSDVARLLLKFGADPNVQDDDGYTALHRAFIAKDSKSVEALRPITDSSLRDKHGRTVEDFSDVL